MTGHDREEGSVDAVSLAVLTPALLLIMSLIIVAGRFEQASGAVDAAARSAARAVSLDPRSDTARETAITEARRTLDDEGLSCSELSVSPDLSALEANSSPHVTVRVRCVLALGDVSIPGLPGSTVRTATFTSPVDPYRSRT
jgi:Flp pilus assembly protein TadG